MPDLEQMFFGEFGRRVADARAAHGKLGQGDDGDALRRLAQFFHALAGVAPSVGYPLIGKTAVIGEALADAAARGELDARGNEIAIVLVGEALDGIEQFFERAGSGNAVERAPLRAQVGNVGARVLVVDDELVAAQQAAECLKQAGYTVEVVLDPRRALDAIAEQTPDLILLDVNMPGLDGFELCELLRLKPAMQLVPIVFLTQKSGVRQKVKGLRAGADDYVTKPFSPDELVARVDSLLTRTAQMRELAIHDELTHVYNERFFRMRFEQEIERAARYQLPLSLALVEIAVPEGGQDSEVGELLLCQAVRLLQMQMRATDLLARVEGRFAVLLPHTPGGRADSVIDRLARQLAETDLLADDRTHRAARVTVKSGVVEARPGEGIDEMLERAARSMR